MAASLPSARLEIPDIQDGITPGLEIGPGTEIVAGERKILTAGGIDTHIHFIAPQQAWEALYSGVTTMMGGGTGPQKAPRPPPALLESGTSTGCWKPGRFSAEFWVAGQRKCQHCQRALEEQILAGALGLKLHEDWGTTPAAIDTA